MTGSTPQPTSAPDRLALLTLLAGAACIGFAPILVRYSHVGPSATAGFRVLFALPVLWAWMWWDHRVPRPMVRRARWSDFPLLALAGLLFVGDLAIWHWSLQFTTVAKSTLLANFAPLFATLGAWLLLGERVTARFCFCLVLALAGVAMLVLLRSSGTGTATHPEALRGDLLAILAAVFYAAYLLMVKRLRRSFTGLTIMAWTGLVSCPVFLLAGITLGESVWPQTALAWGILLLLGWISHLGGQTLIATAMGRLPASFSSIGLLLQPVIAAVLAWFLFAEHLSPLQILGGLIVLAGIGLASQKA